jgi:hypothetical protein
MTRSGGETSCVNPQAEILFGGRGGGGEEQPEAEAHRLAGLLGSVRAESGERQPVVV